MFSICKLRPLVSECGYLDGGELLQMEDVRGEQHIEVVHDVLGGQDGEHVAQTRHQPYSVTCLACTATAHHEL